MIFQKNILPVALLFTSSFSQASSQISTIDNIQIMKDGRIAITLTGVRANKPACSTNQNYFFIADENSTAGKSQLSLLLAAHAAGRQVEISGADGCIRHADGEDVNFVRMPKS